MRKVFPDSKYPIRYFLGDVRDQSRLNRAFDGVNIIVHAAALKQVPDLEYNHMEAVKTNIFGANNIVEAAINQGVERVVALSTDKASNPINLYGATKLVAEKVFIAANAYAGGRVKFSVVRYGNVMGSRGSVIPLFLSLKKQGIKEFPITDERMTRFWITIEESVQLVFKALKYGLGGECFVPIIPSMKIVDLAKAINPRAKFKIIGIRPGEKLHESLISLEEGCNTKIFQGCYVLPSQFFESDEERWRYNQCPSVSEGFFYRSDKNQKWMKAQDFRKVINIDE